VILRSDRLEVQVLPEVGGKVAQIRDLRTGQPLLIPPQKPHRPIPSDEKWVDQDVGGMDDCFPNIDECLYPRAPWQGLPLPQLGEWVYGGWSVVESTSSFVSLERTGTMLPYRASKNISLNAGTLEMRYSVENSAASPIQYLWSAHALVAVEEEFQIYLPEGERTMATFPPGEQVRRWPSLDGVDLSGEWIPRGQNRKVFISGLREGWCVLRLGNRTARFEFDVSLTPVVGVWFNNFGFPSDGRAPYRCVAIEPCTSASDVLDASESPRDPVIPPFGTAEWWLRIRVE
jgi:hypothetical protein